MSYFYVCADCGRTYKRATLESTTATRWHKCEDCKARAEEARALVRRIDALDAMPRDEARVIGEQLLALSRTPDMLPHLMEIDNALARLDARLEKA